MVSFLKAEGLGNDFIIIDISQSPSYNWQNVAKHLSDRRLGIGFDQMLIFKNQQVWFYNADGSCAESCGNGTRCLARYLMKKQNVDHIDIETPAGKVSCFLNPDETVTVSMPNPSMLQEKDLTAQADLFQRKPVYVRIGNPHLVCFVDNLDDLYEYGPILSRQDVNVEFAKVHDTRTIQLKVWERGTGPTPACGSGACASVIAGRYYHLVGNHVFVEQEGGTLEIIWDNKTLSMKGPAQIVYEGKIDLESYAWAF